MTGLKVWATSWLVTVGAVAAWQAIITIYGQFLGLFGIAAVLAALATIVTSLGVLGVATVRAGRWISRAKRAVITVLGLDEKFDEHREESRRHWKATNERFKAGDDRMTSIEATQGEILSALGVLAESERAAVRGALEATRVPRAARATDPHVRTGWCEWLPARAPRARHRPAPGGVRGAGRPHPAPHPQEEPMPVPLPSRRRHPVVYRRLKHPWWATTRRSRAVRRWLDRHGYITPHFSWASYACTDGTPVPRSLRGNAIRLHWKLERMRHLMGDIPMRVDGPYRTAQRNRDVHGAIDSRHLYADAADFFADQVDRWIARSPHLHYRADVLVVASRVFSDGGMGNETSGTLHVDARGWRARFVTWTGAR